MASQVVQTLITELSADGAKMRAEFAKTLKETNSWSSRVGGLTKKLTIGIAAGATGAALGLGALVKSSINTADSLSKTSQIVGVNIEDLSKLKHAAELSDVSFESLGTGLKKFSKNIIEAADGTGSQADAFAALGIKLKNADGSLKSTDQLVGDVADSFSKFEDGAAKTAVATELFGKAGADLIPMLNGGRQTLKEAGDEAQRLGLVFTKEAGVAAEQFNDNMTRLEASVHGVANRIANEVTPTLAELTATLQDPDTQAGLAGIASGIISIGASAVKALGELGSFTKFIGEELARTFNGVAANDIAGLEDRLQQLQAQANPKNLMDWLNNSNMGDMFTGKGALLAEIDKVKKEIAEAYRRKGELLNSQSPAAADHPAATEPPKDLAARLAAQEANKAATKIQQDEQKKLNELVASETKSLQEKASLYGQVTELQRLQYRESLGDLKNASAADKEHLESLAVEIDRRAKIKELEDKQAAANDERLSLAELVMTEEQKINEVWDDRIEKMKLLATSAEDYEAFQKAANEKRGIELDEVFEKGKGKLDEFTKNMYEGMQSTLADSIMDGFDGGAEGLLQSFGHLLQKMAAEALAADIMRGIFGGALGGGSGPSMTGSLLSGVGKFFGGMFAEGGRPPIGKASIVGDGGEPELFVPDTAGTIIPFSKLGGGGGASISIGNMSFPGVTNAREAEMAAGAAARKMLGIMSSAQRYS